MFPYDTDLKKFQEGFDGYEGYEGIKIPTIEKTS
tara:strand:+ start:453 stop:554 length:102 start_codon:yes stop_codon:yes gene_type:complete